MKQTKNAFFKLDTIISPLIPQKYKIYTTYGRTALYGILDFIGIKGKDVLLPCLTCNSTNTSAIIQAGGNPIFIGINTETLEMNIDELKSCITDNTVAIISQHYYGFYTSNLEEVNAICKMKGIVHIEDCAHSIGVANHSEKLTGSTGDYAIFSFSKMMPTPAGGIITTDDPRKYEKMTAYFNSDNRSKSLIKNAKTFLYYNQLKERYCVQNSSHFYDLYLRLLVHIYNRLEYLKIFGLFESDEIHELANKKLSIKMTTKQARKISKLFSNYSKIAEQKRVLFHEICTKTKIHPYCKNSQSPMFVLCERTSAILNDYQTVQLWPQYQKQYHNQLRSGVIDLFNKYQLIDLYRYINL